MSFGMPLRDGLSPSFFEGFAPEKTKGGSKNYSGHRAKAKALVIELNGDDELIDILRLTCIKTGFHLNAISNNNWVLEVDNAECRVKMKRK